MSETAAFDPGLGAVGGEGSVVVGELGGQMVDVKRGSNPFEAQAHQGGVIGAIPGLGSKRSANQYTMPSTSSKYSFA